MMIAEEDKSDLHCPISLADKLQESSIVLRSDRAKMSRSGSKAMQEYLANPSYATTLELKKLSCLEDFFIVKPTQEKFFYTSKHLKEDQLNATLAQSARKLSRAEGKQPRGVSILPSVKSDTSLPAALADLEPTGKLRRYYKQKIKDADREVMEAIDRSVEERRKKELDLSIEIGRKRVERRKTVSQTAGKDHRDKPSPIKNQPETEFQFVVSSKSDPSRESRMSKQSRLSRESRLLRSLQPTMSMPSLVTETRSLEQGRASRIAKKSCRHLNEMQARLNKALMRHKVID
jgi:hypothetical protein